MSAAGLLSRTRKVYQSIPTTADFPNDDGSDNFKETIEANYKSIKQEILALVASETKRIMETPKSRGLVTKK